MNLPIDLELDGKTVARILSYSFETPWATGKVEFEDQFLLLKLLAVSSMSTFDIEMDELGLDDEEEERMWEAKLKELGITGEDLKLDRDGRWTISSEETRSQPIYSPRFSHSGFMNWRQ